MQKIYFIFYCFLPVFLAGQSLNESPQINLLFSVYPNENFVNTILYKSYDGIAKNQLIRNIPNSLTHQYTLSHLPVAQRIGDFDSPFGTLFLNRPKHHFGQRYVQLFASHFGELDFSFMYNRNIGHSNTDMQVYVNYHNYNGKKDKNEDHFLDLNNKQRFLGIHKWSFYKKNYYAIIMAYHLRLNETGGEMDFDKNTDYLTSNNYGLGVDLYHTGVGFRNTLRLKNKQGKRKNELFFDTELRLTDQTQFYGLRAYEGKEHIVQSYIGYQITKLLTTWELGFQNKTVKLEEQLADIPISNTLISIPGLYAKMDTYLSQKVKLKPELRINYHTEDKFLVHPNLTLTYQPKDDIHFNFFMGSGTRYPRVIAENSRYLFSGRQVVMEDILLPERAWNYGVAGKIYNSNSSFNYQFLFFHNTYQNINYTDLSQDNIIAFANYDGKAFKTSVNNGISFQMHRYGHINLSHRFEIFKTRFSGALEQRPFYPQNTLSASIRHRWKFLTIKNIFNFIGKAPAPKKAYKDGYTTPQYQWDIIFSFSPNYYYKQKSMKKFTKKANFTLGVYNVTNKKTEVLLIHHDDPFSEDMDGGIRVGNAVGTRVYVGIKFNL